MKCAECRFWNVREGDKTVLGNCTDATPISEAASWDSKTDERVYTLKPEYEHRGFFVDGSTAITAPDFFCANFKRRSAAD